MLGLAFAVFSAAVIMFRLREIQHQGRFGATTVIATMMAFTLGALAVLGDTVVASAGGVATARRRGDPHRDLREHHRKSGPCRGHWRQRSWAFDGVCSNSGTRRRRRRVSAGSNVGHLRMAQVI